MNNEYIENQGKCLYSSLQWGKHSNTANSGCGWISVYNIIHSKYPEVTPTEVFDELKDNAPLLGGRLGSKPWKLVKCLRKYGFKARIRLFKRFVSPDCFGLIFLYMYTKPRFGAHYVAATNVDNAVFLGHNCTILKKPSSTDDYCALLKRHKIRLLLLIEVK